MIKLDIKVPDSCGECPLLSEVENYCVIASCGIPARYHLDLDTKPAWCPIIECNNKVTKKEKK